MINNFLLTGPDSESPFEIMRIFTEAGGDATKASVGHMSSNSKFILSFFTINNSMYMS